MAESVKKSVAQIAQAPVNSGSSVSQSSRVAPSSEPAAKKSKKRIIWLVLGLASLIALFYLASAIIPRVLVYLSRAANTPGNYSLANSYVFGSPLLAQANGEDKIRVTAFLLDAKGRGVPDKQISLNIRAKKGKSVALPQIATVQPITDEFGRSVFEVTSTVPGQFVVATSVNGLEFPQTVTLTFR